MQSVTWDFGDPGSGVDNTSSFYAPIHTFSSSGIYTVQVKLDDCVREFSNEQVVLITEDLSEASQMILYPNPADDYLIISGVITDLIQLEIIDMIGRRSSVKSETLNSKDYKIDISDLDCGLYLMRVTTSNGISQIRFVKR